MYICIDIGGTAIKYSLANVDGMLQEIHEMPTAAQTEGVQGIVKRVDEIITTYEQQHGVAGVAISTAGIVDTEAGNIIYALPEVLPGYTGWNWKDHIATKFHLPCAVENDVNCAALGELWRGAGNGYDSLVCLTIGTSIGGAIIWHKKILHGASHSAGEIAFMEIDGGKLYTLATTTRLVADVAKAKGVDAMTLTGKDVFSLVKEKDADAVTALDAFTKYLAAGLTNVMALLNPPLIVLGGGIMAQGEVLRPLLEQHIQERVAPTLYERTALAFAALGNTAGMVGALYHFLQEQGH